MGKEAHIFDSCQCNTFFSKFVDLIFFLNLLLLLFEIGKIFESDLLGFVTRQVGDTLMQPQSPVQIVLIQKGHGSRVEQYFARGSGPRMIRGRGVNVRGRKEVKVVPLNCPRFLIVEKE